MRFLRSKLLPLVLVLVLAAACAALLPARTAQALSSSNVCQQSYNSVLHVSTYLWVAVGQSVLDTSTGTQVLIIPVKMTNVGNTNLDIHPEKQFTFVAHNGVVYPRAFGVPAVTIKAGFSACFTLGYKWLPGGTGTQQCPFDGAGLSYYNDLNHQQLAANWQLIWAPC